MTTDEIKKQTHIFMKNAVAGIDTTAEYLAWFNTVPENMREFAYEVFDIFEQYHAGRIDADVAKIRYDKTVMLIEKEV